MWAKNLAGHQRMVGPEQRREQKPAGGFSPQDFTQAQHCNAAVLGLRTRRIWSKAQLWPTCADISDEPNFPQED